MSTIGKRFVVRCIRADLTRKDFNFYATREAAQEVVDHLRRVGCPAEVTEIVGRPRELDGCIARDGT